MSRLAWARVIFMGTPDFAVPCLQSLLATQHQVAAVYTQPDRPAGRGREPAASPVKRLAIASGIEVVQPVSLRDAPAIEKLAGFKPDVIIVAAYGLILPQAALDLPGHGVLNVHPSLLPRHRGASPIPGAILEGDPVTGVSIMLMDAGMDTGPVLAQETASIAAEDNALTLGTKLAAMAASMLPDALDGWVRGELKAVPQDASKATCSRLISKEDGEIDWRLPAVVLWRRVRAFYPWPGCYTRWQGKLIKIVEAAPIPQRVAGLPGRVIALDPGSPGGLVGVETGEGVLGLLRLHMEGKKEAGAAEFVRGHRGFIGSQLPLRQSDGGANIIQQK
ncbi:MAG TPA: methionyl-tRNA formyltransferase [Dehalococcoidia bacterium]|nr:methionyl-tRNA formyltransferase [Dehalococcoidia bacterium]